MRIIAGQRRGHKIDGPNGRDARPTSDRIRESIFNILREEIEGRPVIDLFAGTGALGMEALSRGAIRGTFVERNRANVALIRRNLETLRYEDRGTVIPADAYKWVASFEPIDDAPLLVFVDPPYREFEGRNLRRAVQFIARLVEKLPMGSTVVIESGTALGEDVLPDHASWDLRRYGGTHVAIREIGAGSSPEHEPEGPAASGSIGEAAPDVEGDDIERADSPT